MSIPAPSQHPILFFPNPAAAAREPLSGAGGSKSIAFPGASAQKKRLGGAWTALEQMLESGNASIDGQLSGVDPELVLVMEIIGDVEEFYRAVAKIEGFEYLAEIDEGDIDGAGNFVNTEEPSAHFDGTLYMVASNQSGLKEVLKLWGLYSSDTAKFPHGMTRWRDVFARLIDLRRWSAKDRLRGTGILEQFHERIEAGTEIIPVELELWYRESGTRRASAEAKVRDSISLCGGTAVASCAIPDIGYHGMLAHLPMQAIQSILDEQYEDISLIRADEIAFFRPEAQSAFPIADEIPQSTDYPELETRHATGGPLVAVLDGYPLAQHAALRNSVVIDDPDDWDSDISAHDRQHGTAIASLVLHGDRASQQGESLRRPIYVRPVLRPEDSWASREERFPPDQLAIDLVHRSLVRLLAAPAESGGNNPIKLVNLSLGDASLQLASTMSPWARLLDWFAHRYQVLFVISAGNHRRPLAYPYPPDDFDKIAADSLRQETLRLLVAGAEKSRILSPAESINGLCVGASHDDSAEAFVVGRRVDVLPDAPRGKEALPSPVTAIGMGYRRSIKPDLLAPGGRTLYRKRVSGSQEPPTLLDFLPAASVGPGLTCASPSDIPGNLSGIRYFHGTSGAAAIVSHHGGLFLELLSDMSGTKQDIPEKYWGALTKSALVHSACYPDAIGELKEAFAEIPPEKMREAVSRFYGYGTLDAERIRNCTSNRATVLGWGELGDGEADLYEFPLPPSLAGKAMPRRFVITLAYFSPILRFDRKHRAAQLYFLPKADTLQVKRTDANWQSVRRGTVQHEVLRGDRAAVYLDGDSLSLQVNCRSLSGRLSEKVLYGLTVSLEVPVETGLSIYTEVATRLRTRARVRIGGQDR
ncbi:S8 family peptidase [Kitasatospora sp. NPDC051170]|uniref:S8 family peptidase n=1 Tax=Kitasatospora sp. NPDC051170 TaxID=3364056 RepID=UPI003797E7BC